MGDSHVGLQARLMSQALRKLAGTLNRTETICIFTNQLREKIGVMFGNPETTPGGRALKFYSSVRLDIRRIETLKEGVEAIGNRVRVKVVKNKVAPPFKQAEFDIIYGSGISWEGTVLDAGLERKTVQKSGSYFSFDDERLGQGRQNATAFLREHPDVTQKILERIQSDLGSEQIASARLLPLAERRCRPRRPRPRRSRPRPEVGRHEVEPGDATELRALVRFRHREPVAGTSSSSGLDACRGVTPDERSAALDPPDRGRAVSPTTRFAEERARTLAGRGASDALIRHDLRRQGVEHAAGGARNRPARGRRRARSARVFRERGGGPKALRYLAGKGFAREKPSSACRCRFVTLSALHSPFCLHRDAF